MDSSAPRLSGLDAFSLTTIAGKPAPTGFRESVTDKKAPLIQRGLMG
jgi:hypothetical protein